MPTPPRLHLLLALFAGLAAIPMVTSCQIESDESQRSNVGGPVVDPGDSLRQIQIPLEEAPCTIDVEEIGEVDIEEEYIPNVIACENGNAPMEALKAQAVQARGYIYYKLFVAGADSVINGPQDQVYDCDYADAADRHFEAAEATRGEYLEWDDRIIASFYVAGAIPSNPGDEPADQACVGTGDDDPTGTESLVTYNSGLSGCDIEMTPLGWVPNDCRDNPHNRGCGSQNGASCLADRGWGYEQMLRYYYGDDIELHVADNQCGGSTIDHEQHCLDSDDGWSCHDDVLVRCVADGVADTRSCEHGCAGAQCRLEEDAFCADQPEDGWRCMNDETRVKCTGDRAEATDTCSTGCDVDACTEEGGDKSNDIMNDGEDEMSSDQSGGEGVSLVTRSPGIRGGCSQPGGSTIPPVAAILALGLLAAVRRQLPRRESTHFVP